METPKLIEPGMRFFMKSALAKCKETKNRHFSFIFNCVSFSCFIVIITGILIYKYKGKLSPLEKEVKLREQKYYILSKIKKFEETKNNSTMITNLPKWNKI